jgi:hypothetical protein
LKYRQVRDLVHDGVLTNDWRGQGTAIAIRADEHQALSDFLTEVYGAWDRLQLELARHAAADLRRTG